MNIKHSHSPNEVEHRIIVDSDRIDADHLIFVFTDEGLIIDSVLGGVVTGTESVMYDDIENRLGSM